MPPRKKTRICTNSAVRNATVSSRRILQNFKSKLDHIPYPLTCPICKETLKYTHFERHCKTLHDLNPQLACVWCNGQYSWNSRQKYMHISHIQDCLIRFKQLQTSAAVQPSTSDTTNSLPPLPPSTLLKPILLDLHVTDLKLSAFNHDISHLPSRAHDFPCLASVFNQDLITFQNEGLNLAVSCVQLYLDNPNYEWFHVSIRIPAYTRFVEVVKAYENCICILPFSCWCDGGRQLRTPFRQHRHMIVGCTLPDYFLNNIWRKIKVLKRNKPTPRYQALHYTRIKTPLHLVNTIIYVSRRKSQCTFSSEKGPERNNHFCLSESLSKNCSFPLVLLWDDGIYTRLYGDIRNLNRRVLVQSRHLRMVNTRYCMMIKHIPGLPLYIVMPVDRDLEPCGYVTPFKLHLMNGQIMYFDQNPELVGLDQEDWLQRQAEGGNLFYHVVGEKIWFPRPYQQGLISDFKPIVDEMYEVKAENRELKEENCDLKEEKKRMKEEYCVLREEYYEVKKENGELKKDNGVLKKENGVLKKENCKLKEEMAQDRHTFKEKELILTQKCESLQERVNELLVKMNEMNEGENARLRQEIVELKKQMLSLRL